MSDQNPLPPASVCCICKGSEPELTIQDGNPEFIGKPICMGCNESREMLKL